jgi:hypothetical protein
MKTDLLQKFDVDPSKGLSSEAVVKQIDKDLEKIDWRIGIRPGCRHFYGKVSNHL